MEYEYEIVIPYSKIMFRFENNLLASVDHLLPSEEINQSNVMNVFGKVFLNGLPSQEPPIKVDVVVSIKIPSDFVEKLKRDHSGQLSKAKLVVIQNTQPTGYILKDIVPGSIFDLAGLKNDDFVMVINGHRMNGIALGQIIEKVKTYKQWEIVFKRNGKVLQHNLE